jgi:hypothetical protein
MDFKMNAKLDGLYYRTSATPSLCGPYKTVTTYNGCNAAKAESTQAFSRNDFERTAAENAKMISAADQSLYKQILQYPESLIDIIGSKDIKVQRAYVKNNLLKKFPNLEQVLKPVYPKIFKTDEEIKKEEEEAAKINEGYYYSKTKPTPPPTTTILKKNKYEKGDTAVLPQPTAGFQSEIDGSLFENYSRPACSSCRRS